MADQSQTSNQPMIPIDGLLIENLSEAGRRGYKMFESYGFKLYFNKQTGKYHRNYTNLDGEAVDEALDGDYEQYSKLYVEIFEAWGASDWTMTFLEVIKDTSVIDFENPKYKSFVALKQINDPNFLRYIWQIDITGPDVDNEFDQQRLMNFYRNILANVSPKVSVDLETTNMSEMFSTEAEISEAKRNGTLVNIGETKLDEHTDMFVIRKLYDAIRELDNQLPTKFKGAFRWASSVRSKHLQLYYQNLPLPAVDVSNHQFGRAIDIALSNTPKPLSYWKECFSKLVEYIQTDEQLNLRLNKLLEEEAGLISFNDLYRHYIGFYDNKLQIYVGKIIQRINSVASEAQQVSLSNPVIRGILQEEIGEGRDPVLEFYDFLSAFTKQDPEGKLGVLDETSFHSLKTGQGNIAVKTFIPDFHLQKVA